MSLLIAYAVCLIIGQSITITMGLMIDRYFSPAVGVPVSIGLYFAMFWITWKIAVRITEPKSPAVVNANSEGGAA
ncbi:MAG: hypothetical protein QOG83_1566 [Alphaproteobacteria bacterium]|nr:hypothetical protein [Alphaproteobacteria bacterium]MEA2988855.1 hypothetical protein [Alphaproteobacteria bacterium]